jgi:hypothetical protein
VQLGNLLARQFEGRQSKVRWLRGKVLLHVSAMLMIWRCSCTFELRKQ